MSITLRNIKGSPLTHEEMDENFSALTGSLGAGDGLTGGGFLPTGVEFNVGQGDGISVSADSIAVDGTVARTGSNVFTEPQNVQSALTASSALLGGFTYPTTDASFGFVLATDGSGNLFFQQATSGSITSSGAVFPFTGSAGILGSLNVDGTITATTSVTVNNYTLPTTDGASGSIVTTDGSGTLSFGSVDSLVTFDNVEINVKAGEALTKGDPVYISGTVGASERAIVSKADASDSSKMPAIGLAQEDMSINDLGKVTLSGFLRNITTDPIDGITPSSNDTVYVKAGGGLTLTKPSGSNLIQNIAKVGKVSGGSAGTLIVSAILRTNDVPNLLNGEVFYGVENKAVQKPLSDILSGSEFTYSGSFSGSFVGPSINVTSGSFNRLDVTGNSTLDGDLTVTGRVTAEEFHTEFVSASIIYQSGSTKFGDTSDDRHSFTGSVEILGSLTGSSNIDIAGTVDANVYSINGTTVIDSSRNITGSNGTFSGNVDVASLDSSGNVDANTFSIDGSTVIDASENITGASLDVTGKVEGNIISINGSTVIDASENITGASLDVSGEVEGNSFAINTNTVIDSSQNITGASLDVTGEVEGNTFAVDGTIIVDASRNFTGSNAEFTGDVIVGSLDSSGNVDANTISIDGSTVIDASENITGTSLDVTGEVEGNSFAINTNTVIDSSQNITGTSLDVTGEVEGNSVAIDGTTVIDSSQNITGTSLDVSGEVEGNSFAVNNDTVITSGRVINNITQANVDNLRLDGNTLSNTATDQNVTIEATGTGILDVNVGSNFQNLLTVQNDIYPEQNYVSNIGAINKKFLSLNVAELIVETLVASERRSTVGGRFNVGIGTQLSQSISPSSTSILVENNNLNSGDIIHLETGGNVEFMRVDSAASSGSGDGFSYDVTRNLDGTGANTFEAGSGVFNTGQIGNGFIDQYAINSLTTGANTAGPTIAFMERTGSAFQDIDVRTTVGNLKGWYGYSTEIFGFAAGNYKEQNITVDPINGLRIRNVDTLQLQASGSTLTIGDNFIFNSTTGLLKVSGSNIELESPTFFLGNNSQFISGSNGNLRIESTNFTLAQNGDVSMTGTVTAEAGQIGGFAITDSAITGSGFFLSGSATGNQFFISASNFNVKANGDITASNADISGNINAETGTIGGFVIDTNLTATSGLLTLEGATGEITGSQVLFTGGKISGSAIEFDVTNFVAKGDTVEISGSSFHLLNGNVTASNATISGDITATNITAINQGNIAGFTLTANQLSDSGNNLVLKSSGQITGSNVLFTGGKISGSAIEFDVTEFVAKGNNVEISGSSFHLLNGNITASNVDLSGNINAESGTIGGFNIGSNLSNSAGSTLILKGATGQITASAAQITGNITAQTGELQTLDVTGTLTIGASGNLISFNSTDYINLTNEVLDVRGRVLGGTQTIYLQSKLDGGILGLNAAVETGTTDNIDGASFTPRGFVVASQTNNDLDAPRDKSGALFGAGSNIIRANAVDNSIDFYYLFTKLGSFDSSGDFYVDSDTLYVDAGGVNPGKIGINDSTPSYALDVNGDSRTTGILRVDDYARIDALRVGTTDTDPGDGNLYVEGLTTSDGFTSDGATKNWFWRVQNSSNSGTVNTKIATLSCSNSTRVKFELVGQSGYSAGLDFGSKTVIIGQFNNSNNFEGKWYVQGAEQAISAVKVVQTGSNTAEIWIERTSYSEYAVTAMISDGDLTPSDTDGTPSSPDTLTEIFEVYSEIRGLGTISGSQLDSSGNTTVRGDLTVLGNTTISGTVSGHIAVSPVASDSNNSNGVVIQDLSFDSFGHVESLGTVDLDGRYFTETEADGRYLRLTGGTITSGGSIGLTINHDNFAQALVIHRNHSTNAPAITFKNNTGQAGILYVTQADGALRWRPLATSEANKVFHDGYHPNADTLTTARTIGGVSFDGSANINLPGVNTAGNQNTSGNAATATKWQTARTITLGGDLTGNVSIDGSANVTLTAAVVDDSHNHIISNVDGLQTALDGKLNTSGGTITGNLIIGDKLLSSQNNTDVDTGTETVASVAIATYDAAFFDFVVKKSTNLRAGTVYAIHDGTNVEFTETSTQDLGDTSDVTLSVDISGGNLRLLATTTSNDWSVKALVRGL